MRVLYLHGFASSPKSRKATFFREHLQALGCRVDVPDLAEGNFQGLTVSGQLRVAERVLVGEPAVLIGSSLGGYLAALYAARHPEVTRVILLAPAFSFASLWSTQMDPDQLAQWKKNGSMDVFHYGAGRDLPVGYGLLEDAARYEPYPDVRQPTVIFHGNQDRSVPVEESARFSELHSNAKLVRLESGHELTDVLDVIWQQSRDFLQLTN